MRQPRTIIFDRPVREPNSQWPCAFVVFCIHVLHAHSTMQTQTGGKTTSPCALQKVLIKLTFYYRLAQASGSRYTNPVTVALTGKVLLTHRNFDVTRQKNRKFSEFRKAQMRWRKCIHMQARQPNAEWQHVY